MGFVGNEPDANYTSFAQQTITGNGGTSYTLSHAVASGKEILLYINNVKQEEGSGKAYEATGTALTLSEAITSSDSCYCVFLGKALQTTVPPDGSVTTAKLASGAVTSATLPTGCVLQVVSTSYTTEVTSTSASFVDTGLTLSITPSSTSNKILVMVHQMTRTSDGLHRFNLLRGSTSLEEQYHGVNTGGGVDSHQSLNINFLDSPSTTSATTYKTQMRTNGGVTVGINNPVAGSTMILMEIAG